VAAQASAAKRLEAWWAAHHRKVYLGVGLLASIVVWRSMFYVASRFLSFSESVAEAGFLALAASLVLALGTYFSWRRHLDPEAVYRRAWAQLQQSQAVQAALGAPLSHTETRAFVMSGGNLRLKGWVPRLRSRRCNLLFPLSGSHGRGIVSAEAKREKGRYVFKLLAVDVAPRAEMAGLGREARLYLAGDEKAYNATRVLAELRDPLIAQLQAEPAQAAEEEGEVLGLTEGEAAAVAAPAVAQARAEAEEDLYAFDHFVRWLKHKRAAESRAQ